MTRSQRFVRTSLLWTFLLFFCCQESLAQNELVLHARKDNTLYESATGASSNGIGGFFIAGRTNNGELRRAVLAFNVRSSLPGGAVIDSVRLELFLNRTSGTERTVSLHRLLNDWGEGESSAPVRGGSGVPSTSGDATWIHTRFDTEFWLTPGGDFDPAASGSALIAGINSYFWNSTQRMIDDVRHWNDTPNENFGWLLMGDESANQTTKRFDSRESTNPDRFPKLHIYYSTVTSVEHVDLPTAIRLLPNFPNPFHGSTTISFELDASQRVTLDIYDPLGRVVHSSSKYRRSGHHEALIEFESLSPGVYIVRLSGSTATQSRVLIAL